MSLRVRLSDNIGHDRAVRCLTILEEPAVPIEAAIRSGHAILAAAPLDRVALGAAVLTFCDLVRELREGEIWSPEWYGTPAARAANDQLTLLELAALDSAQSGVAAALQRGQGVQDAARRYLALVHGERSQLPERRAA